MTYPAGSLTGDPIVAPVMVTCCAVPGVQLMSVPGGKLVSHSARAETPGATSSAVPTRLADAAPSARK